MAIYRGSGSASSTSDQATIDEVTQQATNAASSATSAASSATSAASSASSASTSASTATTQASNASTSATNAASSASSASTSASSASTSASNAATSESNASAYATSAETAKTGALAAQTAAETAETNADAHRASAASSATTSQTNALTATTKASEASASATTASNAATAAESARDSTLAAFDSFDDRYLGAKTADPTLDNDGNALVGGALYFNTVDEVMKVYTGSQWVAAYADVSGALLAVNNLSDLGNAVSARSNLGVAIGTDVQAYSAILAGTTASFTTADETKLDGIETAATADQTAQEIATAIDADATAEATLKSALGLGTAAYTASTAYATAAQGTTADSAIQPGDNVSTLTNDAGYLTSFTETNNLTAAVTWANVPDANITQSSVTQHQAALLITESQISNLGTTVVLDSDIGSTVQAYDATIVVDADIGVTVQAYDVDTLKADVADTITAPMRGTVTTDNDLSFDMNVTNNFSCTPSGTGTLTFTNITAGQSGNIFLDNSGGHAISAAATTFINSGDLTTISTAGKYFVSYFSPDGTNVYISATPATTSQGV